MGKHFIMLLFGVCVIFSVARAEEIRYDGGERRDPFISLLDQARLRGGGFAGKDNLSVEGIIFDPRGGSYAVIDGEIYKEGEEIEETKLVRILPDRVIFFHGSEEIVVWLREEIVDKADKEGQEEEPMGLIESVEEYIE